MFNRYSYQSEKHNSKYFPRHSNSNFGSNGNYSHHSFPNGEASKIGSLKPNSEREGGHGLQPYSTCFKKQGDTNFPNFRNFKHTETHSLIEYIYQKINISNFNFELLEFPSQLPQLLLQKYNVSANFSGKNCLMIFTKIRDKYYSVLVDRQTLKYSIKKVDVNSVIIYEINVRLEHTIYNGTIFDGIFINKPYGKIFVINDVFYFRGDDYTFGSVPEKLQLIKNYLEQNYSENKRNDIMLMVNNTYELDRTGHLANELIPKMVDKLNKSFGECSEIDPITVKGLCFYPYEAGTKLLYMFANTTRKSNKPNVRFDGEENRSRFENKKSFDSQRESNSNETLKYNYRQRINSNKNNDEDDESNEENKSNSDDATSKEKSPISEVKPVKKEINYLPKSNKKTYTFEMKTTNLPDVYTLNIVEPVNRDNKILLKRIKVGIAYISTNEKSKEINNIFTEGKSALVDCKYNDDFKKWEPIKKSKNKHPDFVTEFLIK